MPSLLLHVIAVERLSADPSRLPPELARALAEDLEYARLGAAIADLPQYDGVAGGVGQLFSARPLPYFARLFHTRAPVAMGLKMAELVGSGALVGKEPGLAFVAGYFSHVCLDRALHPVVDRLVARHRRANESELEAHRRIEWLQALFYLRDLHGEDLLGTRLIRTRLQLTKRRGIPARGIGRGLYEVLRLASQDTLRESPTKADVDRWLRGLYVYGLVLSSPLGRTRGLPAYSNLSRHELYAGADVDFPNELSRALDEARAVLERVCAYVRRGSFTPRARTRFLAAFPEGSIAASAA